jgi:rare lipoprotein A
MTAGIRRVFHRFVLLTLPAALAGTLTIGTLPAQAAAQAKSSKAQPAAGRSSESKSSKTRSKSAAKQGPKTGRVLQSGMASWYGPGFHGRKTANGERFDMYELTAAHKTLPLGSRVMVRNPANGKEVVVRINDRGPYAPGRILDLSQAAASQLGLIARGHGEVVLQALGDGGDGRDAGTGLNARQLAMAEPDPDASPSAKRQAQVLAQTRFGDSKLTLGNPVAAEPAGPSLPLSVAVGPPEGLSSTGVIAVIDAPRMGLNWSPWMRPDWGMQLHLPPSGSAVGAATAQQAPTAADPTPNFLPNAQAKTDVAEAPHATQRARLPLDPARTTPEPGAIAAGDVPLSTSVAMPAAGEQ